MFKRPFIRASKIAVVVALVLALVLAAKALNRSGQRASGPVHSVLQPAHPQIANDQLTRLEGRGLQKVAENDRLALSVDLTDGNIEVTDKTDGFVWRSKPAQEAVDRDPSNNLWKSNLQSPVMVEYIKDYTDSVPNYANAKSPNAKISVFRLDQGARVYFDFQSIGIKMALDYYISPDRLEVDVPDYMIEEPADAYITNARGWKVIDTGKVNKIVGYDVLPFFGAARNEDAANGYMLVPDGPGGKINFDSNKKYNLSYTADVYGPDLSYSNKIDKSFYSAMQENEAFYPVFGINRGEHSMLAVIDRGESSSQIVANPAGVRTSFNNAYGHFIYRNKYVRLTDLTGGGTALYTQFGVNLSRTIDYYFLSGPKSSYVGMAESYRSHLMKQYGLAKKKPTAEPLALQLRLFGGIDADNFFGTKFIAMTTFKQAGEIVDYFHENNVRSMNVVYEGWSKHGLSSVYPADRFPADSHLGGMSGLKSFIGLVHRDGYKVYLTDDQMRAQSGSSLSKRRDTVQNIQNSPLDIAPDSKRNVMVLNPDAIERFWSRDIRNYREVGADGIEEHGLDLLSTDFNEANPMNREEVQTKYREMASAMTRELGNVRWWGGMSYDLTAGSSIVNLASDYSNSPLIDEEVPFYPIALHGLVAYSSLPYNSMDEPEKDFLKAIEYGANVSFELSYEPTGKMENIFFNGLYSTEFNAWKDDVLKRYETVNGALGDVNGLFITDHVRLADHIYKTSYENGKEIVCNYTNTPYTYQGNQVPPMGFAIVKGSGPK